MSALTMPGKIERIPHAGMPDGYYLQRIDWFKGHKLESYRRPPSKEWRCVLELDGRSLRCQDTKISEVIRAAHAAINDHVSKTEEPNGQRKLF
jgi:hypothetical protein